MRDGVSVILPTMHRSRLPLLAATVRSLRRCQGVAQVIIAEMGDAPCAAALAQETQALHLFSRRGGAFDKAHLLNMGTALARADTLLWLDGDFLFAPDFLPRALREMHAGGSDFFYPFSAVHYLGEADTRAVLDGMRAPGDCPPIRTLAPRTGAPGGMGMIAADFLRRHGGMVDGFRGWGCEDDAWLRKATLLGTVEVSRDPGQQAWHLYHADSGSHSEQALRAAVRRNPHYAANARLMAQIGAIDSGAAFLRHFPPPAHFPTPWPEQARLALVVAARAGESAMPARAAAWAARLLAAYGREVPVFPLDPARPDTATADESADAIIGMTDDANGCHALLAALGTRLTLLVADLPRPPAMPALRHPAPMIAARTPAQIAAWQQRGLPVWHHPWGDDDQPGTDAAPAITAALSMQMAAPRLWKVRIELDRSALPLPALDRPRFWYVGLHDGLNQEMARQDLGGTELFEAVTGTSGRIVIERAVAAPQPPATWTIWPTDRQGRWLDKLTGPARAEYLDACGA